MKESEDNLSFIRDFITESDKRPLFKSMLSKVSEFRLKLVFRITDFNDNTDLEQFIPVII